MKIIVMASILALGIFIITENNGVYSSSELINSIKEHGNTLEANTSKSVEMGIGFMNTVDETGDKINTQINNAKQSTKEISEKISEFNPLNKDYKSKNISPEESSDQHPIVNTDFNNKEV